MTSTDEVLDALGDGTRREIVDLLRQGPRPVVDIASRLPVSRPAVSKHLRQLQAAGIVTYDIVGRQHRYRLDHRGLMALRSYVDSMWDTALASFAAAAEQETDQ